MPEKEPTGIFCFEKSRAGCPGLLEKSPAFFPPIVLSTGSGSMNYVTATRT
jgi:hypothetical protein